MQRHRHSRFARALMAVAVVVAALASPALALADDDDPIVLEYDPQANPVADEQARLEVNKLEKGTQNAVKGAVLQLLDADGNLIYDNQGNPLEWTTDGSTHVLTYAPDVWDGFELGKTYILHEVSAPDGYEVAADTYFKLESSDDFKTVGEITKGDDAQWSTKTGTGAEQAFVINLFDAATIEVEREVTIDRTTTTSNRGLASTGDPFAQGLAAGFAAVGLAAVALGLHRRRKAS